MLYALLSMLELNLMLYNFIAADSEHGRYGSMEDCEVSKAEYLVDIVCMNRLSGRMESLWCALLATRMAKM